MLKSNDKMVKKEVPDKILKKIDPVKAIAEKDKEMEEHSPMNPPDAYDGQGVDGFSFEIAPTLLQTYMNEHKVCIENIESFEKALIQFKDTGYQMDKEINSSFSNFFKFFDNNIMDHNQREEKELFPLLHERLLNSEEHGEGENPRTAVDMMEDDHIKFIQLGALTFNMLGLATRLADERSRTFVNDVAYNNGRELIELLRLHIYREENIVFPLAHKLISPEEYTLLAERKSKK